MDSYRRGGKIMIGRTKNNERISIDSEESYNNSILISGKSGTGKSTFLRGYIESRDMESGIIVIPDFTGDWKNRIQKQANIVNCRKAGLPVQVLKRQRIDDDLETDYELAARITSIFSVVLRLGRLQSTLLQEAIQSEIERSDVISWSGVLKYHESKAKTENLCLKIQWIAESGIFENMNSDMRLSGINIFDLSRLSMEIRNICMEFFLWWLFDYVVTRTEKTPVIIVLDEFQRMNFKEDSPLFRLLTEGRKYGVELLLATQTVSIFKKEQKAILEQVGTRLYFQPSESEISAIVKQFPASIQKIAKKRLQQLPIGHALAVGKFKVNGQARISNNPIEIII